MRSKRTIVMPPTAADTFRKEALAEGASFEADAGVVTAGNDGPAPVKNADAVLASSPVGTEAVEDLAPDLACKKDLQNSDKEQKADEEHKEGDNEVSGETEELSDDDLPAEKRQRVD